MVAWVMALENMVMVVGGGWWVVVMMVAVVLVMSDGGNCASRDGHGVSGGGGKDGDGLA